MRHALRTLAELATPTRIRYPEVPPLDLGLTPNDALEGARDVEWFAEAAGRNNDSGNSSSVDDVAVVGNGTVAVAHGCQVTTRDRDGGVETHSFAGRATALAGRGTGLVVAVEGHGVYELVEGSARLLTAHEPLRRCVTALLSLPDGGLLATTGSQSRDIDGWAWDLFDQRATGSVVRLAANGDVERTRSGLAWAAGLALGPEGTVLVSVAHAHCVEKVDPQSLQRVGHLTKGLAVYPWRISAAPGRESWWIAMPLLRSRFTELLMGEKEFLADMMNTVAPESWYGPSMAGGSIYREPLQFGGLRVLGQIKPWAPPRSYGLVAEIDAGGQVLRSFHSRAGGSTHGVVAAAETNGQLLVAARSRAGLVQLELPERRVQK